MPSACAAVAWVTQQTEAAIGACAPAEDDSRGDSLARIDGRCARSGHLQHLRTRPPKEAGRQPGRRELRRDAGRRAMRCGARARLNR